MFNLEHEVLEAGNFIQIKRKSVKVLQTYLLPNKTIDWSSFDFSSAVTVKNETNFTPASFTHGVSESFVYPQAFLFLEQCRAFCRFFWVYTIDPQTRGYVRRLKVWMHWNLIVEDWFGREFGFCLKNTL